MKLVTEILLITVFGISFTFAVNTFAQEEPFPKGRVSADSSQDPSARPTDPNLERTPTQNQAGTTATGSYSAGSQVPICEKCETRNTALLSNNNGVLNASSGSTQKSSTGSSGSSSSGSGKGVNKNK